MTRALIVVDTQNGFLREGNLASEDCLAALPAIQAELVDELQGHLVRHTS